ncbi:phosphatidylserine/phosphatidylglycerophosphate/cardiolipin synthase-like enzyme [Acinetobacter calcoaceticus]|uniref:phospholipase D n=1 Tax=Acinetobacter calcoaceticus TaxID=471 RepID=A0A4R1XUG2_ACICA|nr:phosphatidylserine/phosphatidylglycerophosphate/cardiolipin synthase-like enzyme [Acinetobacter calcoaceticus]
MRIFRKLQTKLNWSRRRYLGVVVGFLALGYVASAVFHSVKTMPAGLDYTGPLRHANVKFLVDQSYVDAQGQQQLDQQIFDQVLQLIAEAESTIVIDMFLFNAEVGTSKLQHRPLTKELTDALAIKRQQNPNIEIKFITDPINSVYGGMIPQQYAKMRQSGVEVMETDLAPLRTPNPAWSGLWYLCCQGVGNNPEGGWLPNPFGNEKITIRSYLNLLNFKANHRKTIMVDTLEGWKSMVISANPHDGSSRHSNVGLLVSGHTAIDLLNSERAVATMSGGDAPMVIVGNVDGAMDQPQVQVLTEAAIYRSVVDLIKTAKAKESIDLMMFYLSEREIIQQLMDAKDRGVNVRVLLDPNKDAFGREKNGMPNRQVASELHQAGIDVRWCNTQGEQCHSKMIIKRNPQQTEMILGSANFTARNLKNYNLETDLRVIGAAQQMVFVDAGNYFNSAWSNLNGRKMSVDYAEFADESTMKYWTYRFMEWSGMSTF